ncbi:hypothetical protein AB1Y20_004606 [Prymnesium parvum]|uniref:ADP,ATP carrier protein n=1 Tax=Prymnesium parvum TaxID=97485 RepID=A0AB34J0T7_PRYPA
MSEKREIAVGMACSAAGPSLACLFTNPADVAKTRLAMERELLPQSSPRTYNGLADCLVRLWRTEGIGGLQRGLTFAMVREGSKNSFRLGLYDPLTRHARKVMGHDSSIPAPSWLLVAVGATTGAVAALICNPLDLLKTRMQLEASHPAGATHPLTMARKLWKTEGFLALWRGCSANMARSSLATSITLPVNSKLKERWPAGVASKASRDAACAMVAAGMTTVAINPIDVVRVRLYSQPTLPNGAGALYRGSFHCFYQIASTEGLLALWKGVGAAFLRIGPHTVLTFTFIGALRRSERRWRARDA